MMVMYYPMQSSVIVERDDGSALLYTCMNIVDSCGLRVHMHKINSKFCTLTVVISISSVGG